MIKKDFEDHWFRLTATAGGAFTEVDKRLALLFYEKGTKDEIQRALRNLNQRVLDASAELFGDPASGAGGIPTPNLLQPMTLSEFSSLDLSPPKKKDS